MPASWRNRLAQLESGLLLVLFAAMVLVAGYQIFARNLFGGGISWGDGFVKFAVLWIAVIGGMLASRNDAHIRIDVIGRLVTARWRGVLQRLVAGFTCAVTGLFTWVSVEFVMGEYQYPVVAFGAVPSWVCALILPIGFGVISLRYLVRTLRRGPGMWD